MWLYTWPCLGVDEEQKYCAELFPTTCTHLVWPFDFPKNTNNLMGEIQRKCYTMLQNCLMCINTEHLSFLLNSTCHLNFTALSAAWESYYSGHEITKEKKSIYHRVLIQWRICHVPHYICGKMTSFDVVEPLAGWIWFSIKMSTFTWNPDPLSPERQKGELWWVASVYYATSFKALSFNRSM